MSGLIKQNSTLCTIQQYRVTIINARFSMNVPQKQYAKYKGRHLPKTNV